MREVDQPAGIQPTIPQPDGFSFAAVGAPFASFLEDVTPLLCLFFFPDPPPPATIQDVQLQRPRDLRGAGDLHQAPASVVVSHPGRETPFLSLTFLRLLMC